MKISELLPHYQEYYDYLQDPFFWAIIDSDFKDENIREFYKVYPKQFKEGDGSHPDMTIEQCNEVLGILEQKGYEIRGTITKLCTVTYPFFMCKKGAYFNPSSHWDIEEHIPYQVWLNWLGVEPKEEIKPNVYTTLGKVTNQEKETITKLSSEMNTAITEHQKRMLAMYNPDANGLESGLDIAELKEKVNQLGLLITVAQLQEEIKYINLNQYAGRTRRIMNLINQL